MRLNVQSPQVREMLFNRLLITLLSSDVVEPGEKTLKSGITTNHFYNFGKANSPKALANLALIAFTSICPLIQDEPEITFFTSAYKGIMLTTAIALKFKDNIPSFGEAKIGYQRKEEKDHGEMGSIVGHDPEEGESVFLIDDVITSGSSILQMYKSLQKKKVNIKGAFAFIDRTEGVALKKLSTVLQAPVVCFANDKEIFS